MCPEKLRERNEVQRQKGRHWVSHPPRRVFLWSARRWRLPDHDDFALHSCGIALCDQRERKRKNIGCTLRRFRGIFVRPLAGAAASRRHQQTCKRVHDMHVLDLYIAGCSPFWHLRWTRTEFRRSFPFSIVMHALQGERERESGPVPRCCVHCFCTYDCNSPDGGQTPLSSAAIQPFWPRATGPQHI